MRRSCSVFTSISMLSTGMWLKPLDAPSIATYKILSLVKATLDWKKAFRDIFNPCVILTRQDSSQSTASSR
ncbi:hypothetical protein I7I48_11885 [Histoplasma ohiense]|nr:hypothetical protein I7I48_11885 [Histoplasma ohiense (nom. inval.)]